MSTVPYASQYLEVDVGNDGAIVFNAEAFINKLNNILDIQYGTMPFMRRLGNNLEYYLFKSFNLATANLIAIDVENSIKRQYSTATVTVTVGTLDFTSRNYPLTIQISHPSLTVPVTITKSYQSYA
jgi:phage baseplate assembly protein W